MRVALRIAAGALVFICLSTFDRPASAQDGPVSGNPAATTAPTGTGGLGRTLGLEESSGITLGGLWLSDLSIVAAGGVTPGALSANNLLSLGVQIDADKLVDWRGAKFGALYTRYDGDDTNRHAGTVPGYNGIVSPPPHDRMELNELWYLQSIVDGKLQVRVGRVLPTLDFNNVERPVAFKDERQNIPALSGLLYSSIAINPTMLGVIPGYFNPGDGVTVNITPTKEAYVNIGIYDGNNARGIQSGFNGPQFNNYWFTIAEAGINWVLGDGKHPGKFGIGTWKQTGVLTGPGGLEQNGTGGLYLFGSQRIAYGLNSNVPNSSVSIFYQYGSNDSLTLPVNRYYSVGITGFGLIGGRTRDSIGAGIALSQLNPNLFTGRTDELMIQAYYQAHLHGSAYLQPTVTYIPVPGAAATLPATLTGTLRLTVLF